MAFHAAAPAAVATAAGRLSAWLGRRERVTCEIVRYGMLSGDTVSAKPNFENFATPIKRTPGRNLEMAHAISARTAALLSVLETGVVLDDLHGTWKSRLRSSAGSMSGTPDADDWHRGDPPV